MNQTACGRWLRAGRDEGLLEPLLMYIKHVAVYKAAKSAGFNELLPIHLQEPGPKTFFPVIEEKTRKLQDEVVRAGYGYANYIREAFSIASTNSATEPLSREHAIAELETTLGYTAETLGGKWETTDKEIDEITIHSRWGVDYTLEQLLEHAIVHILRHRRQIERFLGRDEMS